MHDRLDPVRLRARRQLRLLAAAVALLVLVVAAVAVRLLREAPDDAPTPRPTAPMQPSASRSAGPAVVRREVAGVRLPFSPVHGPRVTDNGRAAGYTRDRAGAALAAVHVLTRTSATAGPDVYRPVLAGQVVGANAVAMSERLDDRYQRARHQNGTTVRDGDPIPGNNATVAGYLVTEYDETARTALVDVLLAAPGLEPGQVVEFSVSLQWTDGDWRALAPPTGDWGTLARLLSAAPAGTLDYAAMT